MPQYGKGGSGLRASQGTWRGPCAQNVPVLGTRFSHRRWRGRSHPKPALRCWARLRWADVPFLPACSLPNLMVCIRQEMSARGSG